VITKVNGITPGMPAAVLGARKGRFVYEGKQVRGVRGDSSLKLVWGERMVRRKKR